MSDFLEDKAVLCSQLDEDFANVFAEVTAGLGIQRDRHRTAVFCSRSRASCAAAARGSGAAVMGRPTTR